ncbi:hypothetical protein GF336_07250 [Candidatus Woesearchaeota archaeon]|nr:hypothetical protein [Candidatus Woesearchaeota archaeon]
MDKKRVSYIGAAVLVSLILIAAVSIFLTGDGITGFAVFDIPSNDIVSANFSNHTLQINATINNLQGNIACNLTHYSPSNPVPRTKQMLNFSSNQFTANLTNATDSYPVLETVSIIINCTNTTDSANSSVLEYKIPNEEPTLMAFSVSDPKTSINATHFYLERNESNISYYIIAGFGSDPDGDALTHVITKNNTIVNQSTSTSVSWLRNPGDYTDVGYWIFEAYVTDGWGNDTKTVFVNISGGPPQWSNNRTNIPSGNSYSPGTFYQFNITWIDDENHMDTALIEHNFTGTLSNYSMYNLSSVYLYNQTELAAGTYTWKSYANDTVGFLVESDQWTYTVEKAASSCLLNIDPSSPQNVSSKINASCSSTDPQTTAKLYRNGNDVTASENNKEVTLPAGLHNYTCNSSSQNYTYSENTSTMQIDKFASSVNLTLDGTDNDLTINKGDTVNITGFLLDGDTNIELYIDGTLINNDTNPVTNITQFNSSGTYTILLKHPETANYTSFSETHTLIVLNPSSPPSGGGGNNRCRSEWSCTPWTDCTNNTENQTRKCYDIMACSNPTNIPETVKSCPIQLTRSEEPDSSGGCLTNWTCTEWGPCLPEGRQYRNCTDMAELYPEKYCFSTAYRPKEVKACTPPTPESPAYCPIPWWAVISLAIAFALFIIIAAYYDYKYKDAEDEIRRVNASKLKAFIEFMILALSLYLLINRCISDTLRIIIIIILCFTFGISYVYFQRYKPKRKVTIYKCPVCKKKFRSKDRYKRHIKRCATFRNRIKHLFRKKKTKK